MKIIKLFTLWIPKQSWRKYIRKKLEQRITFFWISKKIKKAINADTLFVIGDSHTDIFHHNTWATKFFIYIWEQVEAVIGINIGQQNIITYHLGPYLAYTTNKHLHSYNSLSKINRLIQDGFLPVGSKILCVFGEIDCRAHVKKQADAQKKSIEKVVADIIASYGEFLLFLKTQGYQVVAYGPVASQSDQTELDAKFPEYGTEVERNKITKVFNENLAAFCKNNQIGYVSIFEALMNQNFTTKADLYRDGIHLSDQAIPLIEEMLAGIKDENTGSQVS